MRSQIPYTSPDAFVCRYADKSTVLFYYVTALFLGAAVIHFIYDNETVREVLAGGSGPRDERKTLLVGFSVIWLAILADFLLQLRAFLQDRPALVMTAEGVAGLHGGLWREMTWTEIDEVEVADRHIRFVRRPRNAFSKYIFGTRAPRWAGFRGWEYCIHVLLARTDASKIEILRIVRNHRPDLL
jgi:hypothetical protein